MTTQEKEILKLRLGLAIKMKVDENKLIAQKIKENGIEDNFQVDSLRKLESASGIPYASIQQIVTGSKNASFTTISAIIEGLEMKLDVFFADYYYKVSESELDKKLKAKKGTNKNSSTK